MQKTYRFKVNVCTEDGVPYLNINPIFSKANKMQGMYPISFSQLAVPILTNFSGSYPYPSDEAPDFFLDFENSLDENKNGYGESYLKRDKQKEILSRLEQEVEPFILEYLAGNTSVLSKGMKIAFSAENGYNPIKPGMRLGKFKRSRTFRYVKAPTE